MIVDGRAIASDIFGEIRNEVSNMDIKPHLTVFTCASNFETKKFLALKRRKAEEVGIVINVIELPETVTTKKMIDSVKHSFIQTNGVIIQLPLPEHIDAEEVLKAIPKSLDVDVVHYDGNNHTSPTSVLPPVVGAIKEIAERHDVLFAAANTVVVGDGKLVGTPARIWAEKQGAQVTVVTKLTKNLKEKVKNAHILILGAGQPGLITVDMVSDGVVIFDAGTSEENGMLKGDADPECATKAVLFTPVPGGIGPITVAILLRNLVILARGKE